MSEFEHLARGMSSAADESARLDLGVEAAVELVGGCDRATVTVVANREFTTPAATDDAARMGDHLQYVLDEGPCLDTVREHETVVSLALPTDPRWPRWAPQVHASLGTSSMLCLLLYTDHESYGALNLYGDRLRAFDTDDLATARALAGHLAVAMAAGRKLDQMAGALGNRTVIGQAEGILMERLGLDAPQAFGYLKRISQSSNVKLIRVAEEIVSTRRLPDQAQRGEPT